MPAHNDKIFFDNILPTLVKKASDLTKTSAPLYWGIVGPSASGKSTLAEFLKKYLAHHQPSVTVSIIPLDNFIYPNNYLSAHNLMSRKGFPVSFNASALKKFVAELQKNEQAFYEMPFYSHKIKDIEPHHRARVPRSQIYIFEGINLFYHYEKENYSLKDVIDWSIYLDIDSEIIKQRSLKRFSIAYQEAKKSDDPPDFFKPLLNKPFEEVHKIAQDLWQKIDIPTITNYIEPQKKFAAAIVTTLPTLDQLAHYA